MNKLILQYDQLCKMAKNMSNAVTPVIDSHTDERRTLSSVFNGDFDAKQLKIATPYVDAIL